VLGEQRVDRSGLEQALPLCRLQQIEVALIGVVPARHAGARGAEDEPARPLGESLQAAEVRAIREVHAHRSSELAIEVAAESVRGQHGDSHGF
jgi:hypothetical protein